MTSHPFQPAPNVVQLNAIYGSNNEVVENVFHYSSGVAPDATTMNALIDAYITWETVTGKFTRNQNTVLKEMVAIDLSAANGTLVDRAVVPQISGTVAGTVCPNNVTVALAKRTGQRGRNFRGRVYHIGMAASSTLGNQITDASRTALLQAYTLLITLGVAPIFHMQVLSKWDHTVWRGTSLVTPVTGFTMDPNLDSQRRRLAGHNRHR